MKDNSFHLMVFSILLLTVALIVAIKINVDIIAASKEGYFCPKCGRGYDNQRQGE